MAFVRKANMVLATQEDLKDKLLNHYASTNRNLRLPVAFAMRTLMSLSAFARGIGSVSVSQTALAVLAMDCSIYINFYG